jgi:hypothetical protein
VSLVETVTVPSGAFDDGFAIQQGRGRVVARGAKIRTRVDVAV